jgi:LysR family transcriptional regulator, regulator for metE and metH
MVAPASETRHLSLLVELADGGSMNAAAKRLHLTPSALSQQLKELEQRLGGRLFEREWRQLRPTPAALRLTECARSMLGELLRAESDARALLRGETGCLRVATACQHSYGWLPAVLRRFKREFPGLEVEIVPDAAAFPGDWLAARKLDVALVAHEKRDDRRLSVTRLFRDELVAVVGRGHPWFGLRSVPLRAFAEQHLFSDEGALRPDAPLGQALDKAGVRPGKLTLLPALGGAPLEMARADLGVAIMARWILEPALRGGELAAVRIGSRGLHLSWSVATRNENAEPALARFVSLLCEHHPRSVDSAGKSGRGHPSK